MFSLGNMRLAVTVGVLALSVPLAARVGPSSLAFLLFLPFLTILVALFAVAGVFYLAYTLDSRAPTHGTSLAHAARPLAFSTPAAWQAVLTRSQWSHKTPQTLPPLLPDLPIVSSTLNDILIYIVRDFVLVWYTDISTSPSFPMAVSSTLHDSIERFVQHSTTLDTSSLVVKRILPKITAHIEQFRQSEVALRGAGLERRLTHSEELDMLLASRYAGKGNGRLHPAVDNLSSTFTRQSEEAHLRGIADKILSACLPEVESQSTALKIVVREILACSVLYPVMEMLADPDFWNRTIEQVAGAAIHQQKLVSKVRNVLEAQSFRRHAPTGSSIAPKSDLITVQTDVRQFESFLRGINRCSSLLDARRLKNDIMGELRRTRQLLSSHENEDWINGEKTEDVVAFLDRLYTAKRTVEQRIVVLGGEDRPTTSLEDSKAKHRLSLRDVLGNPASLSYLMEFMDRRHRSLLVQFWLTVESFKNPLESVDSTSSGDEEEQLQDPASSKTLKEDISMINDLYFAATPPHPSLSSISLRYVNTIRSFALESNPSPAEERRVRRSVMLAQRQVEQDMEQDFEEFQKSELWFRVIEDADLGNTKVPPPLSLKPRSISPPPPRTKAFPNVPRSESTPTLHTTFESSLQPQRTPPTPPTSRTNIEVLMSPVSDTASETHRAPLFDDPDDSMPTSDESQRIEAIQAALTDIIATDQGTEQRKEQRDRMNGLSSSVLSVASGRGMFDDDTEAEEPAPDDEEEQSLEAEQNSFQLAGPGDLQLSYEINRLGDKITKLEAHDSTLDALIRKAELTGDAQELRLLRKAKSSMSRELRELQFQKSQYEQQESANRLLSDRTRVSIVSSTVGEEGGKSVVRYLIEIQQLAQDGTFASGWVVARRYNEFSRMHNKLREHYGVVRNLDFPGKRLVTALSASFVDTRRVALERYMQSLISIPAVCESQELRTFLSRESPFIAAEVPDNPTKVAASSSGRNLVQTFYRSVAESIDDMIFGPSMLDVMIQRLTRQAAEFAGIVGTAVNDEDFVAQALKAFGKSTSEDSFMQMSGGLRPLEGETSTSTFSAPICDLVLAIFELNKKNNWLRRQAIVIILQQVFGDTVERKVRESVKSLYDESRIMPVLNLFKDALWPVGKLRPPIPLRTNEEKARTRDEANRKLSALIPDLAANMMGRSNARRGARRIFAVLQNRRLNQHIAYTILDEVVAVLFPPSATSH